MRRKCTYFGSPWIGMFLKSTDNFTFLPIDSVQKLCETVKENLRTEVVKVNVGGSNLVGAYIAMNSFGAILPNVATQEELSIFKSAGLNVYQSRERSNAHGNNICVNDKGGIINPHIPRAEREKLAEVLGVELVPMHIAKFGTVGSSCIANNMGFLVHYAASNEEVKAISDVLKVGGERGTVNMGAGFVSFGFVQNKHGYIAGEASSAFELGRLESALGYI